MDQLPKILYVDDEQINLTLFQMTFRKEYQVLLTDSGSKGIDLLNKHQDICFVISDMRMPKMDGLEFIEKVKQTKKELPCILLSGYAINDRIASALDSGLIQDYIMKPFNKQYVMQLLDSYCG